MSAAVPSASSALAFHARAVLFDLDGTLLDSAPDLATAANHLRSERGLPALPLAAYRSMVGAGARGMIAVAFGYDSNHPDYEALRQAFYGHYQACLTERTQPFAQVPPLLAALEAAGMPWGVVTNKAERFSLPLTRAMPLFANAATVISGDTTAHAKPHPEPLLEAARRLGVAAADCVYVGDDERDIQAGRAAGMFTVAALYGYLGQNSNAAHWGADACIETPEQLLKILRLA